MAMDRRERMMYRAPLGRKQKEKKVRSVAVRHLGRLTWNRLHTLILGDLASDISFYYR